VDFLGQALLTELMMELLHESSASGQPAVVISMSSNAAEEACDQAGLCRTRRCNCMDTLDALQPRFLQSNTKTATLHFDSSAVEMPASYYGLAKWAQIYWTKALAEREGSTEIMFFSFTPGMVALTGTQGVNNTAHDDTLWRPAEAAATPALLLAASHLFRNGGYYSRNRPCTDPEPPSHGFTTQMQRKFLEIVNHWTNLDFNMAKSRPSGDRA